MKNDQTLQQPITQSRQKGAQTTSAHLHWCGADTPSSWPTHVAGHKGHPQKRGYILAIFAGFSVCNAVGLLILLKLCPVFTFLQQLMTKRL